MTARRPHSLQQIERASDGVVRFRQNAIVRFLLDAGPFDLHKLAFMQFSDDDREQFAQLIGYSVSGFGELSYANPETIECADVIAATIAK